MKITIVPAQITSVEDRIAGNLSFTQLLLMIVPVFISAALIIFLPPFTALKVYKLIISGVIALISMLLAIRIKGKLVLQWIMIRSRYNARPINYVYNKNDSHLRYIPKVSYADDEQEVGQLKVLTPFKQSVVKTSELLNFEKTMLDPQANFYFSAKKGMLRVHIKEVK